MTVIVVLTFFVAGFLPYYVGQTANICPPNFVCILLSECQLGLDEGELLYPCRSNKHICCPKIKQHIEKTTHKYDPFNTIRTTIDDNNFHYSENKHEVSHIRPNSMLPEYISNNIKKQTHDINKQANIGHEDSDLNHVNEYNKVPDAYTFDDNKKIEYPIQNNIGELNNTNENFETNFNQNEYNNQKQTSATENFDQIRFNIPDYTTENEDLHMRNHSNYITDKNKTMTLPSDTHNGNLPTRIRNDSSIVTRRAPFQKNCGLSMADNKITGGQVAELGQFPWMALLGFRQSAVPSTQYLCGGSLITSRHILTAAHCIVENRPLELVLVRLGEYNLTSQRDCVEFGKDKVCADQALDVPVDRVTVHPSYNRKNLKNDIAIIRLRNEVRESDYIRTVCLPFDRDLSNFNLTGHNFTVSGWGKSETGNLFGSNILQYAKVTTWDQQKCNNTIPPEVKPLSPTQLCANGPNTEDACKGDSGGPLINTTLDVDHEIRNIQYGIVSFGTSTCGDHNLPTIYTRVDKYLQWIVENVT